MRLLGLPALLLLALGLGMAGRVAAGPLLAAISTDQARYAPRSPVKVSVTLANRTGRTMTRASVTLSFRHLDALVATLPARTVTLAPGGTKTVTFTWTPPPRDFQGYRVGAEAHGPGGQLLDETSTAVDVSSTWTRFPRSGYVSAFPSQSAEASARTILWLKNYHVNAVQFYDWQVQNTTRRSPAPSAAACRVVDEPRERDQLRVKRSWTRSKPPTPAAWRRWSTTCSTGPGADTAATAWITTGGCGTAPMVPTRTASPCPAAGRRPPFTSSTRPTPGWQEYLLSQEAAVFAAYPFDGWQVDQIGDQGP